MYNNKIYLGLWRFGGGGESSTAMSESLSSLLTVVVSWGGGSIGGPRGILDLWIEAWGDQMGGWLRGVSLMLRGLPKGLPRGLPRGLPKGLCSFCGFSSFLISSSDTSSWWRLLMQKKTNKSLFKIFCITVKLDDKERLDSEQLGSSDTFPLTNLSVYFINNFAMTKQFLITKFDCIVIILIHFWPKILFDFGSKSHTYMLWKE